MRELVEFVARALVTEPDEVRVMEHAPGQLELSVAPGDLGKIIGRRGRTARALRVLVRVRAGHDRPAELEIAGAPADED